MSVIRNIAAFWIQKRLPKGLNSADRSAATIQVLKRREFFRDFRKAGHFPLAGEMGVVIMTARVPRPAIAFRKADKFRRGCE